MMKNHSWYCACLDQNPCFIASVLSLVFPSHPQRKSKITASRKLMLKVRLVPWEMEGKGCRGQGGRGGRPRKGKGRSLVVARADWCRDFILPLLGA